MKKFFALGLLILSLIACTVSKEPDYKGVENVKVESYTTKNVTLTMDAVYYNPNDIGGDVARVDIDVFMDGKKIANATAPKFSFDKKSDFKVPLRVVVPYKELKGKGKGLLGNIVSALTNKKIKLQYKGKIVLDLKATYYNYEMDEEIEFDLKK
jgi:LEA14-like dessication related protein